MQTFSVIINCHNYGRFVGEAIESVLAQDYPRDDIEIIVIDDGSTDDSALVVAKFGNRLRYIQQSNSGQAVAINRGVAESTGKILCLLDADDCFQPNKLTVLSRYFNDTARVSAVYNRYDLVTSDSRLMLAGQPKTLSGRDMRTRAIFGRAGGVPTSCISVQKQLLSRIVIPREFRICADTYLLVALALLGDVHITSESLTAYRQHGHNAFLSHSDDVRRQMLTQMNGGIAQHIEAAFGIPLYDSLRRLREHTVDGSYAGIKEILAKGQRDILASQLPVGLKFAETVKLWLASASAMTRAHGMRVAE